MSPAASTEWRAVCIGRLQWEAWSRLRDGQGSPKVVRQSINQRGCEVGWRAASSGTACVGAEKGKQGVVSPFLVLQALKKAASTREPRDELEFQAGVFFLQNPKIEMELGLE